MASKRQEVIQDGMGIKHTV